MMEFGGKSSFNLGLRLAPLHSQWTRQPFLFSFHFICMFVFFYFIFRFGFPRGFVSYSHRFHA